MSTWDDEVGYDFNDPKHPQWRDTWADHADRARKRERERPVIRILKSTDIRACPHFILVPEHYRADGSCRCDDPNHADMKDWGYVWRDGGWRGE